MEIKLILSLLSVVVTKVRSDNGFAVFSDSANHALLEECSTFNPNFAEYPKNLSISETHIRDIYPGNGCKPPAIKDIYKNKVVIVKRQKNCTFAERANVVQEAGGLGLIVVSESGLVTPEANQTDYDKISITVSLISNESYNDLRSLIKLYGVGNVFVDFYAPKQNFWDANSLVMWFIAVFTCAFGAWMQGVAYLSQITNNSGRQNGDEVKEKSDNCSNEINVKQAIIFFIMCSVMILLMYFFYSYLVYVIIGIFCLASCLASFDLIYMSFEKSTCFTRQRIPKNNIPLLKMRPSIFGIFLFLSCVGVSVFWAVNRHASYAWILQDVLGFAFCVHMIKQIGLPSFKVSCLLLVLFFFYDIFYVFITPFFTKNNESIMVKIATGGDTSGNKTREELPMLFKLPRFFWSPYQKCGPVPYSMLGYGDVILPGLHVGFCAVWDIRMSRNTVSRHSYYIAAVFGYAAGLILTFIGMYFMMMGQPALLYLTPCCLTSTLLVACKRKELKAIWNGHPSVKANSNTFKTTEEQTLLTRPEDA